MTSIWARALAVVVALPLSAYAIGMVSNGWTYNDSVAITYPIIAAIPAFLGVLLLGLGLALGGTVVFAGFVMDLRNEGGWAELSLRSVTAVERVVAAVLLVAGGAGLIGTLSSVRTMSRRRGSVPGSAGHELH